MENEKEKEIAEKALAANIFKIWLNTKEQTELLYRISNNIVFFFWFTIISVVISIVGVIASM